jgi:hypothetical protein
MSVTKTKLLLRLKLLWGTPRRLFWNVCRPGYVREPGATLGRVLAVWVLLPVGLAVLLFPRRRWYSIMQTLYPVSSPELQQVPHRSSGSRRPRPRFAE